MPSLHRIMKDAASASGYYDAATIKVSAVAFSESLVSSLPSFPI
jgi:hypothetical protein